MSDSGIRLPSPLIEPRFGEELTPQRLADLLGGVQRNFDYIAGLFPISQQNLADATAPVTSLPTSGNYKGRRITLIVDEEKGWAWELVYVGGTNPWFKLGGPPLFNGTGGAENSTTSTVYTTLANSPSILVPYDMKARIWIDTQMVMNTSTAFVAVALFTSAGGQVAGTELNRNSGGTGPGAYPSEATLTKATTYTLRYKTSANEAFFGRRSILIDPLRLG